MPRAARSWVNHLQPMRPHPDLSARNMCGFVRVTTRQFGQSESICATGVKAYGRFVAYHSRLFKYLRIKEGARLPSAQFRLGAPSIGPPPVRNRERKKGPCDPLATDQKGRAAGRRCKDRKVAKTGTQSWLQPYARGTRAGPHRETDTAQPMDHQRQSQDRKGWVLPPG